MASYRITLLNGDSRFSKNRKETPVKGYSPSLQDARKKAVAILTKNDVKGQIVNIYNDKGWVGTVSMQTDSDIYVKPSVGLRNGIQFMWDDSANFYTCYSSGKVKRW